MNRFAVPACALALTTAAWPVPVSAEASPDEKITEAKDLFERLDRDGDGFISPAEAKVVPSLDKEFKRIDTNGDGRISCEEFIAANHHSALIQ